MSENYIETKSISTHKCRIVILEFTEKGKEYAENKGYKVEVFTNGTDHRYWKWKIAGYYKRKKYKVEVEKYRNGKADIVVDNNKNNIAIEIETGKSNVMDNIRRNIKAGYDEIIVVALSKSVEERIINEMEKLKINDRKIKVVSTAGYE